MTGAFVLSWRISPPVGRTIMVREGGSVFFAACSKFTGWVMLCNGREEAMTAPPTWWWCDEAEGEMSVFPASNEVAKRDMAPPATRRGQFLFDLGDRRAA